MSLLKNFCIVDSFYKPTVPFPMPAVLVSVITDKGSAASSGAGKRSYVHQV